MRISDWSSDVCSSDLQLATRLDRLILLIVLHFGDRGGIAQRIEQAFQLARNLALLGDSNSLRLILEFVFPFVETEEGIAGLAGPTILTDRINQPMLGHDRPDPLRSDTIMITSPPRTQIGRASCRERGCRYVSIRVVAGTKKKK